MLSKTKFYIINLIKMAGENKEDIGVTRLRESYESKLNYLRWLWKNWELLADALLENGMMTPQYIESLSKGKKLGSDVANKLMEKWYFEFIAMNLDRFEWLNHEEVAELMILEWHSRHLVENIDKFEWLDDRKLAEMLILSWKAEYLFQNIKKFKWIDTKMETELEELRSYMREWHLVGSCLEKIKWLNHNEIVKTLLAAGYPDDVVYCLDKFEWLDLESAKMLVLDWYWKEVAEHPETFWLKKEK